MIMDRLQGQRGNVLFLILIAVVLFGILSYTVVNSTRVSGDGGMAEKRKVLAARVAEDCATLRMTTERFMLNRNLQSNEIVLNVAGDETEPCRTGDNCLFSATGGQAYVPLPPILKGAKGALDPEQMTYEFYSVSDGQILDGYNANAPLPMMQVKNINELFCEALNVAAGRRPDINSYTDTDPNFRDECVMDVGVLFYRCPLARY